MPTYEITAPDGRTVEIDGPQPPSEAVLAEVFSKLPPPAARTEQASPSPSDRTWTDTAVDALPMLGGFAGGILGGLGGTVAGVGVGGVPGAIGGATLGGAAGESAKQLINRARGEDAPATPAEAASSIAGQGVAQGASELLGAGVGAAAKGMATGVYRGYLKPSLSKQAMPRAREIVQTALDEALPITKGGEQTATRLIGDLKREVEGILAKSTEKIDLHAIAEKVRGFARVRYNKPGVDPADFKAAMAVADKIDAHPSLNLPPGAKPSRVDVSLTKANQVKQGLDDSITDAGFGIKTGAQKTTEKVARSTTRIALEKKAAAIAPLNNRERKLIDASKAIAQAVAREANNNQLTGWKTLVSGAVGSAELARGESPESAAATALALRVGLHPAVASRAAIVGYRISKQLGIGTTAAARLAVHALTSGDEGEQEQ